MVERGDGVESLIYGAAQLDADIPLEGFQGLSSSQGEEQQAVHKLAATHAIEVGFVGILGFVARAQSIEGDVTEVLGIVVIACDKGVETAGKAVDGSFECRVVLVWEDDMKLTIDLCSGQVAEVAGNEGETYQIALVTLFGSRKRISNRISHTTVVAGVLLGDLQRNFKEAP